MTTQQHGTLRLPNVAALPAAGRAGRKLWFEGAEWTDDGVKWVKAGGAAPVFGAVTIDVGAVPTPEFLTTVDVADAAAGSFVQAWLSHLAPGKDDDEVAADVIDAWAYVPAAGKLTIRLTGMTGFIHDRFTVHYLMRSPS